MAWRKERKRGKVKKDIRKSWKIGRKGGGGGEGGIIIRRKRRTKLAEMRIKRNNKREWMAPSCDSVWIDVKKA